MILDSLLTLANSTALSTAATGLQAAPSTSWST
jgi:hypothetical protein